MTPLAIARACLQAYVDKDRAALEALVADDFHFSSPLDNAIDRATYFTRCWPNSATMSAFDIVESVESADRVFVVYEANARGERFRNAELHVVRDSRLVSVEVYFGWDLPHAAAPGCFIPDDDEE